MKINSSCNTTDDYVAELLFLLWIDLQFELEVQDEIVKMQEEVDKKDQLMEKKMQDV